VRQGGGEAVSATNVVGLILSVAFIVFLVIALIFPEKF
jgi:K+-transporting ATPase KdpF subunit